MKAWVFRCAAVLMVISAASFGGDCLNGSDCANLCPLAKAANARLATGHESVSASQAVRDDFVRTVLANMEAI